jgi:hypothetical protein
LHSVRSCQNLLFGQLERCINCGKNPDGIMGLRLNLKRVFRTNVPTTTTCCLAKNVFRRIVDAASNTHFIFSHIQAVGHQAPRTITMGKMHYLIMTERFHLLPAGRFELRAFKF